MWSFIILTQSSVSIRYKNNYWNREVRKAMKNKQKKKGTQIKQIARLKSYQELLHTPRQDRPCQND